MWLFINGFCQQTALFVTNVSRRRTNQTRNRVCFHIFRHIKTLQWYTQSICQLFSHFCFTDTSRARKQKTANRFVRQTQPRPRHFHCRNQHINRIILTKNHVFQITCQILQHLFVIVRHSFFRNPRHFRHDGFNLIFVNRIDAFFRQPDALRCTSFINNINGFVWQKTFINVFCGQFCSCLKSLIGVGNFMMLLKRGF